jgi:hypothetical protein
MQAQEQLIHRLRATLDADEARWAHEGAVAGARWAQEIATIDELDRLAEFYHERCDQSGVWTAETFEESISPVHVLLFEHLHPEHADEPSVCEAFWMKAVPGKAHWLAKAAFVNAFVAEAVAVFESVRHLV